MAGTAVAKRPTLRDMTNEALSAVQHEYDTYNMFPGKEERDAVVLWTLHTHVFRSFASTPRLSIRSREPGSGKSRVLEVAQWLVHDALVADGVLTPAVLWRTIQNRAPVIMLDECDTVFGKQGSGTSHRTLRAVINAGHRKGATIPRCVGSEDVKDFAVFAPMMLVGIGRLPETIAVRSVEIVMRKRKSSDPKVKPFRHEFAAEDLDIARKMCEGWGQRAAKTLATKRPDMPVEDRKADVWEPLIAIADLAGEEWGKRARKACVKLTRDSDAKPVSVGVRLLGDIRKVFPQERPALVIQDLTHALHTMDESPYDADQFTSRDMARLLSEYGVSATTARIDGRPQRAYKRDDFNGAWERYTEKEATS